jgi:hypothetical protein
MQHNGTSKIKKENMKVRVDGRLKWLMEYIMATESGRIDGGDN